jgi:hypothetical protein
MAEAKKTRLTRDDIRERLGRGESVILEDGTTARSLADLPAEDSERIPIIETPPATPNPPTPPAPTSDGLDELNKAQLIEIATKEGSDPKTGTNDEIREGIRKKRAEAAK